ncbi:hypothetical protein LOTGIDRAFT_235002 [Lottia gigantea]|uniref:RGS domain-containing protein n=1 Tax=Lottia gigantea TaxID=225164 RepID=V4A2H9_LOTGI|nr:hypothetical protein LOTGIDRAFT_235002 [Lottia gigantea]ESO87501.1 hypothetical protein LOTGIDRAFT_235002 [Lottia gigantea]
MRCKRKYPTGPILKDRQDIVSVLKPPEIEEECIEDFLATDSLFVEYFNTFLSLPSFPEPLCFNEETGGFEVVTDAKKELAKQIKAAVRSQTPRKKMYRVVKNHSFIDIPLIPIEESEGPEKVEIDTSFTVTTLNKEQGIHWVKAERLPAFLESDCYLEYRLSKILSQARLTGDSGEFVIMKIDFRPRIKKSKEKPVEEEEEVDPKEELIKNMYVSLGTTETTESDAWFSQAQSAQDAALTFTTLTRPLSSSQPGIARPASSRPRSAISGSESYRTSDSGFGSPMKSSVFSSAYFGNYTPGVSGTEEVDEENIPDNIYIDLQPTTPRPSDTCCVLTGDQNSFKSNQGVTYSYPKSESTDSESGVGDTEDMDYETESQTNYQDRQSPSQSTDNQSQSEIESVKNKSEDMLKQASTESIVVSDIDELGSVIVGAVLKRSIAEITGVDEEKLEKDERITSVFSDPSLTYLTLEMLEHVSYLDSQNEEEIEEESELPDEKPDVKDEESDVDSLLDSEDDYEEGDEFFRKHKIKTFDLSNKKGIHQFKLFLKGTVGEKYFNLWIDIDRSHLFPKDKNVTEYLIEMREKYHMTGSPYELSKELKSQLKLVEPSSWTVRKLQSIQNKIAEPLVSYWAPRFLLKQLMKSNPKKYYLYHHQHLLNERKIDTDPNPPTKTLLPLRPKSCHPRIHTTPVIEEVVSIDYNYKPPNITSPPIGMRRSYSNLPKQRPVTAGPQPRPPSIKKTPRDFLEPRLRVRPSTAKSHSALSRSSSAKLKPNRSAFLRPGTAGSSSSTESWESTSVTVISATPQPQQVVRPPTASQSPKPILRRVSQASIESEFIGGRRMEALLRALGNEKYAGGFFTKFIERSGNNLWKNCLKFWLDVQEYKELFYHETIEPFKLKTKSQYIYSKYVVVSAPCDVNSSSDVRSDIYHHINPPYEELFDDVEEHVLEILYSAWISNLKEDVRIYNKVELIDVKRHLETKSKYVLHLQKRGLIKERVLTPDDPMGGYEDPVYDPSLFDQIPDDFVDLSLEKLVHNRIELDHFRDYLSDNYASMDLMCWMDIEAWRRIPHTDEKKRDQKAKEIKTKYLNKKYFFGPNSPAGKEGQDKVAAAGGGWGKLLEDKPPNALILEAQKYVKERLEKKWFPLFLTTDEFAERQKIDETMADVVDDVMVQRRRRSQAVWKLLESRWTSSTKEIIQLRKALQNPSTEKQFRRYVSIKGDNLENNVLFWQEVQKYKNMYHVNADEGLLLQKINAIINCFLDSQIPPSIQIDITHDMADKIIDRRHERGPYLFREAQLAVFRVLSSHWEPFCQFRENLADDKIMPTIERQRRHARIKEKKRQKELEERMEKKAPDNKLFWKKKSSLDSVDEARKESVGGHDPFKHLNEDSIVDDSEFTEKDRVNWSYSNYMQALEKEEILNNTDESLFSSLSDLAGQKDNMTSRPLSAQSTSEPILKKTTRFEDPPMKRPVSRVEKLKLEKSHSVDSPTPTDRLKSPPVKVERTISSPILKTPKPTLPPATKCITDQKQVKYSRGMPPLVRPREK